MSQLIPISLSEVAWCHVIEALKEARAPDEKILQASGEEIMRQLNRVREFLGLHPLARFSVTAAVKISPQ